MDLPQTAEQLYALAPEEFTAARDAAARQARADGDRQLAREVAALRRPTVSAWLVNRLVRKDGDLLEQLLGLGPALAEAQRSGEGETLRALGRQRRQLVAAVADRAVALAGREVGAAQRAEVAATLEAALADPDAAAAVRSGRLVRALAFAGFGGADLTGAVAAPGGPPRPAPRRPPEPERGGPLERERADRAEQERRRALADAEAAALAAAGALDDATRACERAARARDAAGQAADAAVLEVGELRAALDAAEQHRAAASESAATATEQAEAALAAVAGAQVAAEQARATLDRLRRRG